MAAGNTTAAEKINVNRELLASDRATSDLTACIVIDMPKKWDTRFQQSVEFRRIVKGLVIEESTGGGSGSGGTDEGIEDLPPIIDGEESGGSESGGSEGGGEDMGTIE